MSEKSQRSRVTLMTQAQPLQRLPWRLIITTLILAVMLTLTIALLVGEANAQDPQAPTVQAQEDSEAEATASTLPGDLERISWGAIFAGTAMALVVQLVLNLLGLALGASTIDPVDHSTPDATSLGMGAMAWMGISSLISLFAGGWVAGRLAGMPDNTDAMLHGLITWALVTLVSTFFVTTSIGSMISGATAVMARGISAAGKTAAALGTAGAAAAGTAATAAAGAAGAAASAAGSAADSAENALHRQGMNVQTIENDIKNLLQRAGIDVQGVQAQVADAAQQVQGNVQGEAQNAAKKVANNPSMATAQQEISTAARRLMSAQGITDADRQAVMNSLTSYARMTQQEAQQTLRRWENSVENAKQEAEQTAREAAQKAARAIAAMAAAVFAALVIGAFAAGLGGIVGAPEELPVVQIDAAGS